MVWESNLGFSFCQDIDLHLPGRNSALRFLHLCYTGKNSKVTERWEQIGKLLETRIQREEQLPFYFTKKLLGFVNHPSYFLRLWLGNLFSFSKHVSICLPLSTSLHPIWLKSIARVCAFLRATYASARILCQIAASMSCLDIQTDFCDLDPYLARLSPGFTPLSHVAYSAHPHPSTF